MGRRKLTPLFEKAIAETGRKIRAQVKDGVYTATLFTLYGAMEKARGTPAITCNMSRCSASARAACSRKSIPVSGKKGR